MENEQTLIPPVQSGTVESSINLTYDHHQNGDGGFGATGQHSWEFDLTAYNTLTGLDLGADYPWVPQSNGHTLRIVTDYRWRHSKLSDDDSYTLGVEERGVRGTTSWEYYYTRCGYYDVEPIDGDLIVTRTSDEPQPYRQRESDGDVPHLDPYGLVDVTVSNGEELVYGLHSGRFGSPITKRLEDLIVYDSPDNAVGVDTYKSQSPQAVATGD